MQIKIDKQDIIKLKSFCTTMESINKMKRQPREQKKILTNEATHRDQSPNYTNNSCISIAKSKKKKWAEDLNRYFSKEDMQMAKKHMKGCLTSLFIDVQIKTIMRYQLASEWPSSKSLQTINAEESVEKKEPCNTIGGNVNWYNHLGEHMEGH